MLAAGALVPALADDLAVLRQYAADHGIRPGGVRTTFGQAQRARHQRVVGC